MTDRHTAALAAFQREHPEHSRSIEIALYYITIVCRKKFTLRDSFGAYRAKFVGWCVRNHLPYGMAGQCFGRLLSHRYRKTRISVPDDFISPVILTPLGLGNVRWTLDYYREHPVTEYPADGSLFGRNVQGRTSICERCVHNQECELCPKFTWKCPIDRYESKIEEDDTDTFGHCSRGFRNTHYGGLYGVGLRKEIDRLYTHCQNIDDLYYEVFRLLQSKLEETVDRYPNAIPTERIIKILHATDMFYNMNYGTKKSTD